MGAFTNYGYHKILARNLRRQETLAEKKLWYYLRNLETHKFRQQFPVGNYIVDFCCLKCRLVIELDGGHHRFQEDADANRTYFLEEQGFRVIRFPNEEVIKHPKKVILKISEALQLRA